MNQDTLLINHWTVVSDAIHGAKRGSLHFVDNLTPIFRQHYHSSFPPLSDETLLELFTLHI